MRPTKNFASALSVAALLLCGCTTAPADGLTFRTGRGGETIISLPAAPPALAKPITPPFKERTYVLTGEGPSRAATGRLIAAGISLPTPLPRQFHWEGAVLVHVPTGARLPREHSGCRLAALAPIPSGYSAGGIAEYDCRPATDLTYLSVVFAGNIGELAQGTPAQSAARLAAGIVNQDVGLSQVACALMDFTTVSGHPNRLLAGGQCGARWGERTDNSATHGTAAIVLTRGTTFVAVLNTCVQPTCDANRLKFGQFMNTFDQGGLRPALGEINAVRGRAFIGSARKLTLRNVRNGSEAAIDLSAQSARSPLRRSTVET